MMLCFELSHGPHLTMPISAIFSPCASSVLTDGSHLQDPLCSWRVAACPPVDVWLRSCCWAGFEHLLKLEAGWELLNSSSSAGFLLNNLGAFEKIIYLGGWIKSKISHSGSHMVLKCITRSQVGAAFRYFSPQGKCFFFFFSFVCLFDFVLMLVEAGAISGML